MNLLRHPATLVVLLLIIVLLFGSRRLPDAARSIGQSLKIFKGEVKDLRSSDGDAPAQAAPDRPAPAQPAPDVVAPGTPTVQPGAAAAPLATPPLPPEGSGPVDERPPAAPASDDARG